jgi:hypothetical protein
VRTRPGRLSSTRRGALSIVCAALPWSLAACTLGPTESDGGTGGTTPVATRTLGDQCTSVISEFCQQGPRCAVTVVLDQCISNFMPLCCTGSSCTALSTVSESTVTACKQMFDSLDCNGIVNVANPGACIMAQ